ncbi:MAG: undecaprenyl-diphosphate phosphatase [Treponema sp.]|nr:undecaprenyl-diphosphate phosphatase [Treponema sp.]
MSLLHAVILGAVQGLTEFIPVSSSGHLVLLHRVFGIQEPTLFFDVMLHGGTLLAVFLVLWRDIWAILRRPVQPLTGFLILATVPIVLVAIAFRGPIEQAFETGRFLGFSFLITALLLCSAELLSRGAKRRSGKSANGKIADGKAAEDMGWKDALVVGALQAIAVIPGISRSGATISGALLSGLNRDFAARFAFLLSIPAILGALVLQLAELPGVSVVAGVNGSTVASGIAAGGISVLAIMAGTLSAAVFGFFAVRFMLKIIREKSLFGFAIYTALLGTLVLIDQFGTGIVF